MSHVCPWQSVWTFDNFLRPLFHKPEKMFGAYVGPGMSVVDIGSGAGFASMGLARLVGPEGRVTSVDLQPEMLGIQKKRAEKAGLIDRIEFHNCTPGDIGVTGPFDFGNAFWMVHEVPDTNRFLTQVHEMLAEGGHFFIAEPKIHVSSKNFEAMIESAGQVGFTLRERPKIRFSRAVVLKK